MGAVSIAWAAVAVAGCGGPSGGALATRSSAVLDGVADADHANVVGIVIDDERTCSGSLIGPNLVLTARHCVSRADLDDVSCGRGALGDSIGAQRMRVTTQADTAQQGASWVQVEDVWLTSGGDDICGYDIALLLLASPIDGVEPLVPYVSDNVETGKFFTAVGYGGDRADGAGVGARRAGYDFEVTCVGDGCNYGDIFHANEWRGGPAGIKYVCRGDSGGPALVGTKYVGGVLSRLLPIGDDSSCGVPIYTSTYAWASFLQTRAVHAAMLGGYRAPDWARGGGGAPDEMRFGNACESNTDCTSDGTCVFDGERGYCSYDCGAEAACPATGYACDDKVGLCLAGSSRPAELACFGDSSLCAEAAASEQSADGGACALGAGAGARAPAGAWALAWLGAVAAGLRSRRCRRS